MQINIYDITGLSPKRIKYIHRVIHILVHQYFNSRKDVHIETLSNEIMRYIYMHRSIYPISTKYCYMKCAMVAAALYGCKS